MAEIRDELVLEIDRALRQIDQLEDSLDRALEPIPIEIDPTQARQQFQTLATEADRALSDVDLNIDATGAATLNSELAGVERHLEDADDQAARLRRNLNQAADAFNGVDRTGANVVGTFGQLERSARGIVTGLAALGGAALFAGVLKGANSAIQSFAQLEDSINAVNVVFGQASDSVLEFGETAAETAGLSQAAFNQAVVPIGSLLQNFGFDAREAASASVVLVQRAADLASVMGGTVQDALLAVGAALRGEADPLERYGASISAARVEQFALANGLAATKAEITPAITLQARYGLILADTARSAGDFANTSDDLANAQRSASAAAANFATDVGEVLAPALEVIVGLVPTLLEGLRQLVPAFAAAGDSAAAFLQDASGEGNDTGFINEFFATLRAGAGDLAEFPGTVGDVFSIIAGGITQNAEAVDDAIDDLDLRFARSTLRRLGTQVAADLDKGLPAIRAFTAGVSAMGAQTENLTAFEQAYRDFAVATNLSVPELQAATREMITNAEASNLSAGEVAFLTTQLNILNEGLDDSGRANADYLASINGIADSPFFTDTSRFTTFTSELEEIPAQMDSIAIRTRQAADALGQSLNPFDEPPEAIHLSAREFFKRVTDEINAEAEFQAGIVELILRGHFDLARMIGEQGPAFQETLEGFLADDVFATATEQALQTGQTDTSKAIGDWLSQAIQDAPPGPAREALIQLMEDGIIDSPQVEQAIVVGFATSASKGISSFREELIAEAAAMDAATLADTVETVVGGALDFSDFAVAQASTSVDAYKDGIVDEIDSPDNLIAEFAAKVNAVFASVDVLNAAQEAGQEARGAFWRGASIPSAGEVSNLRSSITETIDSAIFRDSPPKLFLDIGKESGEAFWDGFNQAELNLRTPAIQPTGLVTTTGSTTTAPGAAVSLTINNPTMNDAVSDAARLAQIAGSVAATYNAVRN